MKLYKWSQNNQTWHMKIIKANTGLCHFKERKEKENKIVRTWKLERETD